MNRLLFALPVLFHGLLLGAQDGLTDDFARLSAKERTRLARNEEMAAANDAGFQSVMALAEEDFRARRYDEAMVHFEQARAMRPLNVYPKVKMDDLRALIARRDSAARSTVTVEAMPVPEDTPASVGSPVKEPPSGPDPVEGSLSPITAPDGAPATPVQEPVVKAMDARPAERGPAPVPVPRVQRPAHTVHMVTAANDLPDGVTERIMRTGRAIVLERVQVVGGHATVWRKVAHPWGEVVYFKDGIAISDLTWNAAFGDR